MGEFRILNDLSENSMKYLNSLFEEVTFLAGDNIIVEGEEGDEMFIIKEGNVDVIKNGVKIGEMKSGATFGEMSIIDNQIRSATIRAVTDVKLLKLKRGDFFKLKEYDIDGYATVLLNITKELCQRVRDIDDKLQKIWRWYIKN